MSHIKLKFIHAFVDKRYGGAKARFYFRKRGFKQMPLPGLPGSPEFNEAYANAISGQAAAPALAIGVKRVRPGSIGALALGYFSSPQFLTLAAATQRSYRSTVEAFLKEHGDKPLASLKREHVNALLKERIGKPTAANHWLRMMRTLMRFAVIEELRKDDPTTGVNFIRVRTNGFHTWAETEIAQFEAHHPVGSRARLAMALMLFTASRRSDAIALGPKDIRDGAIHIRQRKTGAVLTLPLHAELVAIIAATQPIGVKTFLVTGQGRAYTEAGFGNWFADCCRAAGLPHCSAHGLRKAACRRLAEAGASANVIMSVSGHRSLREVERYTRAADQARMARQGMAMISRKDAI